jgi:hypothetical protein
MKKMKATIVVAAVAFIAMGYSAQATLVTYSDGPEQLSINYTVSESSGVYTYIYELTSSPGAYLTSFIIGGVLDPVFTSTMTLLSTGNSATATILGNSVGWTWNLGSEVTTDTVSYTSDYGPGLYDITVADNGAKWSSPPLVAAPVPEPATVVAGALMLLPLGVGAFRALRKERLA